MIGIPYFGENHNSILKKIETTQITSVLKYDCMYNMIMTEAPKKTVKESPKKEQPKKKEQNDNIDPETGLANVKDGTHLEEEAKKQEELGIIEPKEEYNEEDDEDWIKEYGNTDEVDDYSEENEYN